MCVGGSGVVDRIGTTMRRDEIAPVFVHHIWRVNHSATLYSLTCLALESFGEMLKDIFCLIVMDQDVVDIS